MPSRVCVHVQHEGLGECSHYSGSGLNGWGRILVQLLYFFSLFHITSIFLFLPGVWSLGQGCNYSARRRNFYSPGLRALSVAHGPGAASTAVPGVATPLTGSSSLGLWWLDGGGGGRSSCRHTTPRGSVRASRDAEPVPGVLSLDPPGGAPYLLEG